MAAEVAVYVFDAVILTAVLTIGLLWRYAAVVQGGMAGRANPPLSPSPVRPARSRAPAAEAFRALDLLSLERAKRRRLALAYVKSIIPAAAILAATVLLAAALPRTPAHLVLVGTPMIVPVVPMIAVALAIPVQRALLLGVALLAVGAVVTVAVLVAQSLVAGEAVTARAAENGLRVFAFAGLVLPLPFLVFWAVGNGRVRGVAPLVLAGLTVLAVANFAAMKGLQSLYGTEAGTRALAAIGGGQWLTTHYGGYVLLVLPAGWLAWRLLLRLSRGYERKRFSDAQLVAATFWLIFATSVWIFSVPSKDPRVFLAGFAACALAWATFPWLLARFLARGEAAAAQGTAAPALLFLRVFGYRRRTERIFDRLVARWRLLGPAMTIAAPDVIARTMSPGDFLRFVAGRSAETFVRSRADLDLRLARLDVRPDPDGRYRITDFCCAADTWQATVVALIDAADVVLMDLRDFAADRAGCAFELQQLAARIPAGKVVLIVDASTSLADLDRAMAGRCGDPNLVTVDRLSPTEADRAFAALVAAAAG